MFGAADTNFTIMTFGLEAIDVSLGDCASYTLHITNLIGRPDAATGFVLFALVRLACFQSPAIGASFTLTSLLRIDPYGMVPPLLIVSQPCFASELRVAATAQLQRRVGACPVNLDPRKRACCCAGSGIPMLSRRLLGSRRMALAAQPICFDMRSIAIAPRPFDALT